MRTILRRFPFTLIGLITYGLFLATDLGYTPWLGGLIRKLIIPMYAGWMGAMFLRGPLEQVVAFPGILWVVLVQACGFLPYLMADYVLNVVRSAVRLVRNSAAAKVS